MGTHSASSSSSSAAAADPSSSTPKTADDTTNSTSATSSSTNVSQDDLITLIQAIKFAKGDASQRQVWKEITEELSQKPGFEFLNQIALNDVKKVWKKALKTVDAGTKTTETATAKNSSTKDTVVIDNNVDNNATTDNLKSKLLAAGSKPSIFTVGQLAQAYTAMSIAEAASADNQESMAAMEGYVHVFLDVPADRSGNKPHQALISFQKQQSTSQSKSSNAKKSTTSNNSNRNNNNNSNKKNLDEPTEEIVKIQRAAPTHKDDTSQHPMLCYNATKTRKTFLHPDSDPEGYKKIEHLIVQAGSQGALANLGGTKAYFYARITPVTKGKGPSILSINTVELAPPQAW